MAKTPVEASEGSRKNLPADQRQLIATARNDITIPFYTDVLQPLDETMLQRGGGKGVGLYAEVERDTHAHAVLEKRKLSLIGREWTIEPASDDPQDQAGAELIESVLSALPFDRLCRDLLDATLYGYAIAEIAWRREGSAILPERVVAHDPRRFVFDAEWRARLLTREQPAWGIELPERKFITHRFGVKGNNPYGLGLGSKLFWPVLFKREGVAFWLTFLEKFASPTPVGKYAHGTLPADQDRLLKSLQDMVQAGAVVVPLGTELTYLEATRAGNAGYERWCEYWDNQMSLCVFGSTLATDTQGQGSRAASETHKEAEEQIVDSDADLLSDTLRETLFRWILDYNLPAAKTPTLRRKRIKNAVQQELLRRHRIANGVAHLNALFDLKARLGDREFANAVTDMSDAGLLPEMPADVLARIAAAAPGPALRAPKASVGEAGDKALQRQMQFAAEKTDSGHDHGMSELADQLEDYAQPAIDGWLDVIRAEIGRAHAEGEDLASLQFRLLALDPELTLDSLGNVMAPALAVAELTGRADVFDATRRRKPRAR
jgi:phage gp29-like protein